MSLRVLGPLGLSGPQGKELRRVLTQPKRLALLAFLALAGSGHFRRRDTVVALFWPDLDQVRARAALRQALSWLRRELGEEIFVSRGDEEIGVAGEALECDAVLFEEACEAGLTERALQLYRGELLEGVFVAGAAPELDRWLEGERIRLRNRATVAAWGLANRAAAAGRAGEAAEWGRRANGLAPHDEGGVRRLIQLLVGAGDRAGALEVYARFCERLRADFDAAPAVETERLMAEVRSSTTRPLVTSESWASRVEPVAAAVSMSPSTPGKARASGEHKRRPISAVVILAALVLVVLATGGLALRLADRPFRVVADAVPCLVVLPLVNASGDSSFDYLAAGLAREVTTALSGTSNLQVVRPGNAPSADAIRDDPADAGRRAGTQLVLAWRLTRPGDSLAIETEITRAADGARIRTDRYAFLPGQLIPVEREIVESLATVLSPAPTSRPPGGLVRHPTDNPDAYLLLLEAEYHEGKRTPEGMRRARSLALEAIDRDPLYADAYAVLSECYEGYAWYGLSPADDAFLKAESAALRAVALDSTSGLAHAALGATLSFFRYRWAEGETEFRRAIALDPGTAVIRNLYALHLRVRGRVPEALTQMRKAQALDPLFRHYGRTAGLILTYGGRDEEAVTEYRKALDLDSTFVTARGLLSAALARLGRYDEALHELRFTLQDDAELGDALASLTGESGYHEATRRIAAVERERMVRDSASGRYVQQSRLGDVLVDLGDREGAISAFERAFAERDPRLLTIAHDPGYRGIRDDPRIQALLQQMNLR